MNLKYESSEALRLNALGLIKPARRITVAESAAKNYKIVNPSGASGNYDPSVSPYMIEPMNLVRSRLYEAIIFAGPARSGKTVSMLDAVIAYSMVDDPADTMVIQMSQKDANDFSKSRIERMINSSPALRKKLSPRRQDNNVLLKFFNNTMALRFGWPSRGVFSGKDLRRVLLTDVDNWTGDISINEGFPLALKRTETYMSAGICVVESSPGFDYDDPDWVPKTPHEAPPASGVLSLYNSGDRRRWFWQCPHCSMPFEASPGLSLFRLPAFEDLLKRVVVEDVSAMAQKYAHIHCPACNETIDEHYKKGMNARGVWVGEGQVLTPDGVLVNERIKSRRASFYMGGVAAAYQSWESLLEKEFQAIKVYANTGDDKPLKSVRNTDQALPFMPLALGKKLSPHELQARCEEWEQGTVPAGVRFCIASIDVQAGLSPRFVVQVTGFGVNLERWIVDRYALKSSQRLDKKGEPLPIDPAAYSEDWHRLLDEVILKRYPLADGSGRSMPVLLTLCDSGGKAGTTQRAYEFYKHVVKKGYASRFMLVKGASNPNAKTLDLRLPDNRKRADRNSGADGEVPVLLLNTTTLKDVVMTDVYKKEPGPGFYHFPKWLSTRFFEELTSERRGDVRWEDTGKPNESLDLAVYAQAGAIRIGCQSEKFSWDRPPLWAEEWDKNPSVTVTDGTGTEGSRPPVSASRPRPAYRKSPRRS